jgi:hypothetical protein
MATYYVRTDGNNANTGTGSLTTQAWATVAYALCSTSAGGAGLVSGDIVYIAPGVYRGAITVGMASATSDIQIIGDTLGSQFANIPAGEVILTTAASDNVLGGTAVTATSKNYLSWSNILFDGGQGTWTINLSGCQNWTFTKCTFTCATTQAYTASNIQGVYAANVPANLTFDRCHVFFGGLLTTNTSYNASTNINITIKDVFCIGPLLRQNGSNVTGISIYNCTIINAQNGGVLAGTAIASAITVRNCVILANNALEGSSGVISENFNRFYSTSPRSGVTGGANSFVGYHALETLNKPLNQLAFSYFGSTSNGGANFNSGTATGAPTFDLFTSNWTGASPDRGAVSWTAVSQITNYQTNYAPTERNASAITIAPASTSQSIELYLGATGLTFATSGLAAYYVRNQSAPVAITLVTQTPTGAWTSGGFAEISSSLVPGVYRLDVPNAAFAAGASDVTIVVRGASGTNGAVLTVTLSSGGLTAAQTAAAVFDAVASSYTTAGSMGARLLKTTVDNRPVDVGTSFHIQSNVHAIVDSTAAASELKGALLHNGTDYIDSNLLGGASTRVFVGRFDLRQTGSETVDTIEVFTTDTPSFELQLTDGDGNEVPVTGATLGLRILDVASTVVETGTPTVEYGTGGIVRWTGPGTYLAIGCPAGMYRLFIDRTVSGTTTTFGPLQIKVQAQ